MSGHVYSMEELQATEGQLREWAYNALDCTGTRKVWDAIDPRLDSYTRKTYSFHRALQAPVLAMMRRGVLVDQPALSKTLKELQVEMKALVKEMNGYEELKIWDKKELVTGFCPKLAIGKRHKWPRGVADGPDRRCLCCGTPRVVGSPFNPVSHEQTAHLLHDLLKLPRERNKKGEESVDDEVLERMEEKHPAFKRLIGKIRDGRDLGKQIGFLKSKLTPDGRMPYAINVAGAWTSRFSSSKNPYKLGTNLQNISERHRHIFIADPGRELFYADLERAESLVVAYISGDENYIKAHEGDTHTFVAALLWPDLPWTGDPDQDKLVAKSLPEWDPVPGHDFRFQAKRIQHGSNFGLTPMGISRIAHIPRSVADAAQGRYFDHFPGIKLWHRSTALKVTEQEPIINPFGYKVNLFGRPWDNHTVRQALALVPQSTVAHVLNLGLWRTWKELDPKMLWCLVQIHDAILGEWKKEDRMAAGRALVARMRIPVPVDSPTGRRIMTIPVEVMAGQNWRKKNLDPKKGPLNPNGMEVIHV